MDQFSIIVGREHLPVSLTKGFNFESQRWDGGGPPPLVGLVCSTDKPTKVGIGILKTNAGIGIPASVISVQYRTKKCRTAPLYSGTGFFLASFVFSVRYRTDRRPDGPVFRQSVIQNHRIESIKGQCNEIFDLVFFIKTSP
jgi:hypothetical protein